MLNRKYVGVAVGLLTAISAAAWFTGCSTTIDGGDGGDAGLRLSSSKLNPGQFLTVFHSSIAAGSTVAVDFVGPGGAFAATVKGTSETPGSAKVMTPPLLDPSTGAFVSGEAQVFLHGVAESRILQIDEPPRLDGVPPGGMLQAVYAALLEESRSQQSDLEVTQVELGAVDGVASLQAATSSQIAALEDAISQLQAGSLRVDLGEGRTFTLGAAELQDVDRIVLAVLNGALEEAGLESISVASAKGRDNARTPQEEQAARNNAVHSSIRGLVGVPAIGINAGTIFLGVAGIALTLGAAAAGSGPAAFLGFVAIMVASGEALYNVSTGPLKAASINAFKNCQAEQFDASNQVLEDGVNFAGDDVAGRVTSAVQDADLRLPGEIDPAGIPGAGALNGGVIGIQVVRDGVGVYQAYTEIRCMQEQMQQPNSPTQPKRRWTAAQGTCDIGGFCTIVRPPPDDGGTSGCNNTCQFANDGACDDGGPGSSFLVVCFLGTDCADCGPRDVSLCSDTCRDAGDGICDDSGPGSLFAICELGTDCNDCGPRGATDGGAPDAFGACCETAGGCTLVTQTACATAGGTYNSTSTTCSPNPCPQPPEPTGACCVSGVCSDVTVTGCAALQGGVYSGDGTACATVQCAASVEYLVWYTGNVSCWEAPLMYIDTRDSFNTPGSAASYPGGGIDPSVPLVKTELQGGFATVQEAHDWICPQFEMFFYHNWCSPHYFAMGQWWLPGGLGCDLSNVPQM